MQARGPTLLLVYDVRSKIDNALILLLFLLAFGLGLFLNRLVKGFECGQITAISRRLFEAKEFILPPVDPEDDVKKNPHHRN